MWLRVLTKLCIEQEGQSCERRSIVNPKKDTKLYFIEFIALNAHIYQKRLTVVFIKLYKKEAIPLIQDNKLTRHNQ